eukprot:Clim_evm56s172 gene=Clim_evmTU56s172
MNVSSGGSGEPMDMGDLQRALQEAASCFGIPLNTLLTHDSGFTAEELLRAVDIDASDDGRSSEECDAREGSPIRDASYLGRYRGMTTQLPKEGPVSSLKPLKQVELTSSNGDFDTVRLPNDMAFISEQLPEAVASDIDMILRSAPLCDFYTRTDDDRKLEVRILAERRTGTLVYDGSGPGTIEGVRNTWRNNLEGTHSANEVPLVEPDCIEDIQDRVHDPVVAKNVLIFESRFESGNLLTASLMGPNEYNLELRPDLYTPRHMQWYFFRVRNTRADQAYKFNIINFLKSGSLYNNGLQPCIFSQRKFAETGIGWHRSGEGIAYYKSSTSRSSELSRSEYTLTFKWRSEYEDDEVYFCHCPPYTYTMLRKYLNQKMNHPAVAAMCTRKLLTESFAGNAVEILTITEPTNNPQDLEGRPAIVAMARTHPGETNGSWMLHGFMDFCLSDKPEAQELRRRYVIKICPMLNPDGVISGNYRCSLSGKDLNRVWKSPAKNCPEVIGMKEAIARLSQQRPITLLCDFHGHSRKFDIFVYGCHNKEDASLRFHERIFPNLFSELCPDLFSVPSSKYGMEASKSGTARIVSRREYGIMNSITMEATFCGGTRGKYFKKQYNPDAFAEMGLGVGNACIEYGKIMNDPEKLQMMMSNITMTLRESVLARLRFQQEAREAQIVQAGTGKIRKRSKSYVKGVKRRKGKSKASSSGGAGEDDLSRFSAFLSGGDLESMDIDDMDFDALESGTTGSDSSPSASEDFAMILLIKKKKALKTKKERNALLKRSKETSQPVPVHIGPPGRPDQHTNRTVLMHSDTEIRQRRIGPAMNRAALLRRNNAISSSEEPRVAFVSQTKHTEHTVKIDRSGANLNIVDFGAEMNTGNIGDDELQTSGTSYKRMMRGTTQAPKLRLRKPAARHQQQYHLLQPSSASSNPSSPGLFRRPNNLQQLPAARDNRRRGGSRSDGAMDLWQLPDL